jgi:hypothetical protein
MATLAEIRAKLLEQEARNDRKSSSTGTGDNAIFPHWNIPEGTTATLRFLPDSDEENTFFWKERQMIRLNFPGVKGGEENKQITVQVPCVEMWDETCPVHSEIRPWFKDPSLEDTARQYWKKRSYLFQGFVKDHEYADDQAPENPIRRFVISPQIFKIISAALMDPDFPEIPTDFEAGTDFKIVKSTKGQYADYSTSNWARRERSLNEEERNAVNNFGLFNLNDFLPKKPSAEELNAISQMFEASVDGQLYDPDLFGQYYRPYGMDAPTGGGTVAPRPTQVAAPTPVVQDSGWKDPEPVQEEAPAAEPVAEAPSGGKASAQDILAAIRNRG